MEVEVQGILVNVLIIFLGQLSIPIVQNFLIDNKKIQYKLSIFVASSISIILCMTFAFPINDHYLYDLRYVPLILGTLYGGYRVGIGLFVVLVTYRLFFGGIGIIITFFTTIILVAFASLLSRKFLNSRTSIKVVLTIPLLHITPLLTGIIYLITHLPYLSLNQWIVNAATFTIGSVILIYLTELIHKHTLLKEQITHFEKSVTVSHLAASIAHEIRNPLTTIKGFLQILFVKEFDEKRRSYYKTIFSELERAEHIIHDYLTLAKPQNDDIILFDTKAELEKTISILTPLAKRNKVNISTQLESLYTKGNIQQFVQALINIIKNGIEAMPNGGEMMIQSSIENNKIKLSICDTGVGLTKDQVQKLGQPYFSTKGDKGTGLGLMVTFNIIQSFGGRVSVESEVNKGTCFVITLPLEEHIQDSLSEVASELKQ